MADLLSVSVVSDATGATAEAVLTSVLVQFGSAAVDLRRFPFTRTVEEVEAIVRDTPRDRGLIVFTFVSPELSEAMERLGRAHGLVVIDVLHPLMDFLSIALHSSPSQMPGVFRHQSEEAFKVTEAIHYTLKHDDGLGMESLDQADLIILGVSRTGKTPTSIYLSCRKLRVANVPIVNGLSLQPEVLRSKAPKVGFRLGVERLSQLRARRVGRVRGRKIPHYSDRTSIQEELDWCENVYRAIPGLFTVDVTDRSIEETSDWITHNAVTKTSIAEG